MQHFIFLIMFFYSSMIPGKANYMLQEMTVQVSDEMIKQEFLMSETTALPRGGLALRRWRTIRMWDNQSQPSSVSGLNTVQQNYLDFSRLSLDSPKGPGRGKVYAVLGEVMEEPPKPDCCPGTAHAHLHMHICTAPGGHSITQGSSPSICTCRSWILWSYPCPTLWHKETRGSLRARTCVSGFRKRKWMTEVQTWRLLSRGAFRKLSEEIWTSSGDSVVHIYLGCTHIFPKNTALQ